MKYEYSLLFFFIDYKIIIKILHIMKNKPFFLGLAILALTFTTTACTENSIDEEEQLEQSRRASVPSFIDRGDIKNTDV